MVNQNIRFLRGHLGLTQRQFAEQLGLKQSVIGAYEEGRATPPLACLLDISERFRISLDNLTREDLSKLAEKEWKASRFKRGKEVLAITVDRNDRENVELVTHKASAGYLNGYQDPEFISELPRLFIPVLPRNVTHRAFEIKGDSMLPLQPGTLVFGAYVENLEAIKDGACYIVVSREEGIVFKRVFNRLKEDQQLLLVSDNRAYAPYAVKAADVLEVWHAVAFFSMKFPELDRGDAGVSAAHLAMSVVALQDEVRRLKKQ